MTANIESGDVHIMFRLSGNGEAAVVATWPEAVPDAHLRAAARAVLDELERRRIANAMANLVGQSKQTRRTRKRAV